VRAARRTGARRVGHDERRLDGSVGPAGLIDGARAAIDARVPSGGCGESGGGATVSWWLRRSRGDAASTTRCALMHRREATRTGGPTSPRSGQPRW
jgi:hypothetical protein